MKQFVRYLIVFLGNSYLDNLFIYFHLCAENFGINNVEVIISYLFKNNDYRLEINGVHNTSN